MTDEDQTITKTRDWIRDLIAGQIAAQHYGNTEPTGGDITAADMVVSALIREGIVGPLGETQLLQAEAGEANEPFTNVSISVVEADGRQRHTGVGLPGEVAGEQIADAIREVAVELSAQYAAPAVYHSPASLGPG